MADLTGANHGVGFHPARVCRRLHAHGKDLAGAGLGFSHFAGFVDGVGHRLFAIDVLASFHGIDAHLGMPVVWRGHHNGVNVFAVQQAAVIFGDAGLIVWVQARALGRREKTTGFIVPLGGATVPHVVHADDINRLALFFHVEQGTDVGLHPAARAKNREVQLLVGVLHAANCRVGKGT